MGYSVVMKSKDLARRLLLHIQQPNYRPVKPRVLAKQLDLGDDQRAELRRAIRLLAKQGHIAYGDKHLVFPLQPSEPTVTGDRLLPAPDSDLETETFPLAEEGEPEDDVPEDDVPEDDLSGDALPEDDLSPPAVSTQRRSTKKTLTGVFRRTSGGFGFVRPSGDKKPVDRSLDVYIPRGKSLDAASGDLVAVRIRKGRSRGREDRIAGEVVEILERDTHRFVGVYSEQDGQAVVQVDGTIFSHPIDVGDPGAKGVQVDDKVVIEMVRFPSHAHGGEAVIVEVLGPRGKPGVDTLSIIREFDLPERFPEEALEDARQQAEKFDELPTGDRQDLTDLTVLTIDPTDARDFDDAISLERLENGHWRLGVHIADVSHFVPARTALDTEAKERATSVYLPDRVIPMLPEIISNNLASLQPQKVRFTKSVFIEFTREGLRVATDVTNAAIRSKRRCTYDEVDAYLAVPEAWRLKFGTDVFELLGRMHQLAMILRRRRLEGGAIELTLPEVKIDLDNKGRVSGAHVVQHTVSHQIIEEFMLAANEAVADFLTEREVDILRRVHDQPELRRLDALTEFVRELGLPCESLQSRFEIKRVLAEVAGQPEEHAVNYAVLRSMAKAVYSPAVEGHYALNSSNYCHFTSPIRRYPDLMVHRAIQDILDKKRPAPNFDQLELLGEHCSEREQRAEAAERELIKVKLLNYLSSRIGDQMEAVITGVERFGLFAQGLELPAEGLVPIQSLQDDYYHFEERNHSLTGHRSGNSFRLGDRVIVEIFRVDVDARQLDFRLLKRLPREGDSVQRRVEQKKTKPSRKSQKSSKGTKSKRPAKRRRH